MLYRYARGTVSYSGDDATATTTTASCDHYCECPRCGYRGTMSTVNDYTFFSFEVAARLRPAHGDGAHQWLGVKRAHAFIAGIPRTRYGRSLRPHGGFRNFHKM